MAEQEELTAFGRCEVLALRAPHIPPLHSLLIDHRHASARFMERDLRDYLQRQGNPLTEHDVAEYMNTLLGGTREQLESLVTARFPVPTSLTSGSDRPLGELTVALPTRPAAPSRVVSREEMPLESGQAVAAPLRPRWLLPVILTLAVILVIMLAVARWS